MPQLNPEFYISQLFWLVISFSFLFIFLWRISLPRIGNILEKRAIKINEECKYNHDVVYNQLKGKFESMPCFAKYSSYTNSKNLPKFVRDLEVIV